MGKSERDAVWVVGKGGGEEVVVGVERAKERVGPFLSFLCDRWSRASSFCFRAEAAWGQEGHGLNIGRM